MCHCNKAAGCYDRSVTHLYTFVLYLALPLAFLRLWWRGFRQPAYRQHWRERLGYVAEIANDAPLVWVHAVSVGEVRAAEPLVNALLQRHPQLLLLMTTTTPTGRETVARLFGDRVRCCYMPWDLPFAIRRFLSSIRPEKVIVLETELWPNLFRELKQRDIPLFLVNARLSDASLRGYRRMPSLVRGTLSCVTGIAAQSEVDAGRFMALGAPGNRVKYVGNLKYEVELRQDFELRLTGLRQQFGCCEPLWVAGSTHPGEEEIVLSVHRRLLARYPNCLLFLVPRHPERAADVVLLCQQAGMSVALYSDIAGYDQAKRSADPVPDQNQVVVVNVLGELIYLYGLASVAFIGGSLVLHGGHNPLEAVQAGCAVVSGEHVDNFADIYHQLESVGAVTCIENEDGLAKTIETLLGDAELRRRQLVAAEQVLAGNRGALARVLALIETNAVP